MNEAIRKHMVEKGWIGCDASDEEFESILSEKLAEGEFDVKEYASLRKQQNEEKENKMADFADTIKSAVQAGIEAGVSAAKAVVAVEEDEPEDEVFEGMGLTKDQQEALTKKFEARGKNLPSSEEIEKVASQGESEIGEKGANMRVKAAVEKWDDTKTGMYYKNHPYFKQGAHATYRDVPINLPTQRRKAMAAVWIKFNAFPEWMTEHDEKVMQHILATEKFYVAHEQHPRLLREDERSKMWRPYSKGFSKATILYDDATSGGQEAVPEFFDTDFILYPILDEEKIPSYCNIVDVPRGSSAETFTLGNLTLTWNTAEGTGVTKFTTDALIADHATTFFNVAGFVNYGRDWEADAVPGMADALANEWQKAMILELGKVIAAGNGTTQPTGITNTSGIGDVTPSTPTSGPIARSDTTGLIFGVNKKYRNAGGRNTAVFLMTDTSYRRCMDIEVGAADARRVLEGDVARYEIEGYKVLIEEEGLSNSDGLFGQMQGYRLYRRQGGQIITEDRGDTLVRSNSKLIGIRGRFGGKPDLAAYFAAIGAWPS